MRPKEIQERLGIDADRIKFFKREGVFYPENPPSKNMATNYTERDLEHLRLLIVLTKSGLTCSDIRKLQSSECTLEEVIISRKENIESDIDRKQNSLVLLSKLLEDNAEFENFDTNHYWDIIDKKETEGEKFIDIEDMYEYQMVSLIRNIECKHCGKQITIDLEDYVYDQSSYEKENGMGPDIVYSFDSEDSYECPDCNSIIHVNGWIREYPVGAYDSESINVEEL